MTVPPEQQAAEAADDTIVEGQYLVDRVFWRRAWKLTRIIWHECCNCQCCTGRCGCAHLGKMFLLQLLMWCLAFGFFSDLPWPELSKNRPFFFKKNGEALWSVILKVRR